MVMLCYTAQDGKILKDVNSRILDTAALDRDEPYKYSNTITSYVIDWKLVTESLRKTTELFLGE